MTYQGHTFFRPDLHDARSTVRKNFAYPLLATRWQSGRKSISRVLGDMQSGHCGDEVIARSNAQATAIRSIKDVPADDAAGGGDATAAVLAGA